MSICSKRALSFEALSRNPIYHVCIESPFYLLRSLPISSYLYYNPNNFRNEHKLMALITSHYFPASSFFSFLGPNAFRRTAGVNDSLKTIVITNKPINAVGKMLVLLQCGSCLLAWPHVIKNHAIKRNENPPKVDFKNVYIFRRNRVIANTRVRNCTL
jgi:hypothetical protein